MNEYARRSTLEWCKVLGIVSTEYHANVQKMFKTSLDNCKQPDGMSEIAAIYFQGMRYIYVDGKKNMFLCFVLCHNMCCCFF